MNFAESLSGDFADSRKDAAIVEDRRRSVKNTDLNNRLRRWINLSQIDWQRLPSDREWIFPNWVDGRNTVHHWINR